jgi:hypothetical protein
MLLVGGWLRWPGDCSWSRLTALLLGRLLGVLLFAGACSMGHAVQWSPMKPENSSGWFPLKSSPTCSYRWLHCDLQNVPREHANCTARTQRTNWAESSRWIRRLPWGLRSRYDWRSVSQYVLASSSSWDLRPDINSVLIFRCCLCWAPSLTRGRVCLLLVTVSNNCPSSSFLLLSFSLHFTRHTFYVYTIYAKPAQAQYSRSCSIICSLHYKSSLNTWTVLRLTTTKPKPLKFSMSRFALPYIAGISITMILYDFCAYLRSCLEADPSVDTARNNSCFFAIVGYHGNFVYRAVAWIPICVTVTSVEIW